MYLLYNKKSQIYSLVLLKTTCNIYLQILGFRVFLLAGQTILYPLKRPTGTGVCRCIVVLFVPSKHVLYALRTLYQIYQHNQRLVFVVIFCLNK